MEKYSTELDRVEFMWTKWRFHSKWDSVQVEVNPVMTVTGLRCFS
jgi:hypothetical protein